MIKDRSRKETKWIIITQIIIVIVILISIFLSVKPSDDDKYMTYKEFSKLKLDDVHENDIYYVKDTISTIWKNDSLKATYFNFRSMDGDRFRSYDIKYQPGSLSDWDLIDNFSPGDRVIATIRIINVEKYTTTHGLTGGGFSHVVESVEHSQ
jgi:hypothetical protein